MEKSQNFMWPGQRSPCVSHSASDMIWSNVLYKKCSKS